MSVAKVNTGISLDNKNIYMFNVRNENGMEVKVSNYGGVIQSLSVADRDGIFADIVLGYDHIADYISNKSYHGALVGRCANRIKGASFKIDGTEYSVSRNFKGIHHIHGGFNGFNSVVWSPETYTDSKGDHISLRYLSRDGEEGYPGNMDTEVVYTLTPDNSLIIEYSAQSDKDTIVNLTNHAFFNLSGDGSKNILGHKVRIDAGKYAPADEDLMPKGEMRDVEGTPFDFRHMKLVGESILDDDPQLKAASQGYDHNWVLDNESGKEKYSMELIHPESGRAMEVLTTMPGVQFYTGNSFDGTQRFKSGQAYVKWAGLCFETQYFPDAINIDSFASPILRAGKIHKSKTAFRFLISD